MSKEQEFTKGLELKAMEFISEEGLDAKDWNMFQSFERLETKDGTVSCRCNVGDIIPIKGYLSTFKNVDRTGDIVAEGAFDKCLKAQKVYPLQRNHNYGSDDMMGDFKAKVDDYGLYIEGEVVCTPDNMHECMLIKSGKLNTLSMGGIFKYSEEKNNKGNYIIESVMLLEGSVVPIPANPKAVFTQKSLITAQENTEQVETHKELSKAEQVSLKVAEIKKLRKEQVKC